MKAKIFFFALLLAVLPGISAAQTIELVEQNPVTITDPTDATAYYDRLDGSPQVYLIHTEEPFLLRLSLLMPDVEGSPLDISARVIQDDNANVPLTVFNTENAQWELYYDEYAQNFFRRHSTFRSMVPAGDYEIQVTSPENNSAYILEVGEDDRYSPADTVRMYHLLPTIKKEFFGESGWKAYVTPALAGPIFLLLLIIGIGFAVAYLWKNRSV